MRPDRVSEAPEGPPPGGGALSAKFPSSAWVDLLFRATSCLIGRGWEAIRGTARLAPSVFERLRV